MGRVVLTVALVAAMSAEVLAAISPEQREVRLLAQVRAEGASNAENLCELAVVREQLGKFALAADTWGLLRQRHGNTMAFAQGGMPNKTWGAIAAFQIARLERKQRLALRPPQAPSAELRRAMGAMLHEAGPACWGERDGQVELLVQSDLDGDRRDEVVVVGRYGRLGERDQRFICLLRWTDDAWQVFARWDESVIFMFPRGFEVGDYDGDGWAEVRALFEPETDNVGIIRSNGDSALWWY